MPHITTKKIINYVKFLRMSRKLCDLLSGHLLDILYICINYIKMTIEKLEELKKIGTKRLCNRCLKKLTFDNFSIKKYKKVNKISGLEEYSYRLNSPCKKCCNLSKQTQESKEKYKLWRYKKIFGFEFGEYERIMEEQFNCCGICGKNRKEFKKDFHLDHNHTTGKKRGLLCSNCNSGFGFFKEDIKILESAIEYKKKFG